jgi:hypothetical protein
MERCPQHVTVAADILYVLIIGIGLPTLHRAVTRTRQMRNAIALSDEHTGVKLESIDCDYTCLAPIAIRASESYRATARREGVHPTPPIGTNLDKELTYGLWCNV